MHTRLSLLSLAALSVLASAQQIVVNGMPMPATVLIDGEALSENAQGEVQMSPNPAVRMGVEGAGGDVDFNRLKELIEQSRKKPDPTPEQQKAAILNELRIDRSAAGILAAKLEESREASQPQSPQLPTPAPANGKPDEGAAKVQQEMMQFRKDAAAFRRDVILGRWVKVREFLAALPKSIAPEVYQGVIAKLSSPSPVQPPPEMMVRGSKPHQQAAIISPEDLLGLAAASPTPPQFKQIQMLAKLLPREPRPPRQFFESLTQGVPHFGGTEPSSRQRAAQLLLEAGFVKEAGDFLPDLAASREKKDFVALNLIARQKVELFQLDPKEAGKEAVPLAWEISTSFLTNSQAAPPVRAEALARALSLIPSLRDGAGKAWLEKTFNQPQGQGLELLASLGTLTAQSRENVDYTVRLEQLRLQQAAVNTIVSSGNVDAGNWAQIFTLYAKQWAYEAEVTRQKDQSNSRRMVQQFDEWGNSFFTRPNTGYAGPGVQPIGAGQILECQPEGKWLDLIEPAVRNECLLASARLLLKVKEENKALPVIRALAEADRKEAKELVRETIQVWTSNHNPNEGKDYRSRYMYFYGFNNMSGAIPLTRSKQERNLVELAALVKGVAALNLGESFHQEFADAFISCHSQAEVWRVEAVESVFGSTDTLDSRTLDTLVGKMRLNLAGLWPNPKLQQSYDTKRKDKELQEQILTGYRAAQNVLEKALSRSPKEAWRLKAQLAALRFEESNYRSTLTENQEHTKIKRAGLDALRDAAQEYAKSLPMESPSEETTSVFETWFYASLGSPTLEALKSNHVASPEEYQKIKETLQQLPDECRARHLKSFATTLNNRLANVAPDLKLRYLEGAAAIVGGHEAMRDASEVLAYYRDLIKEIELDAAVDGSGQVGNNQPFGLRINLRHTREIEREAGGFQKYLQNQTGMQYAFNFGRPTEDYCDKFEKASRAVLEEHFEVVSLTFHQEKIESQTDAKFGWRFTPYAYFLLKSKGPQVDRVPPLKIDLDFNDTSGYVVLPVSSSEVLIDSSKSEGRPFRDLKLVQTLDERSYKEKGCFYLEIKATAHGLIPSLEELIGREVEGFQVGVVEDRGLQIVELDSAADDLAPISEHEWRVELKPQGGVVPADFLFPKVKMEVAKEDGLVRQRYVDVDLLQVGEKVLLDEKSNKQWIWIVTGVVALILAVVAWLRILKRRGCAVDHEVEMLPLPEHVHVVSVIGYLRRLQQKEGQSSSNREAIDREIMALEANYFGPGGEGQDPVKLEEIARRWQTA